MIVVLQPLNDGFYLARDERGERILGSFYPDAAPGWWRAVYLPTGVERQLYEPSGDPKQVAKRLFRR